MFMNTSRRQFFSTSVAAAGAATVGASFSTAPAPGQVTVPQRSFGNSFRYCLNTSTIRGQNLGIEAEIQIAAQAGYDGIEPWIGSLRKYAEDGGSLTDLGKRIADAGLTVDSAIGFARWIVDDEEQRLAGLAEARRDMEMLQQIGGLRIAAPPSGATNGKKLDLLVIAERYRTLLEIGDECGVVPQLEVWGFSTNLSRLGESVCATIETGHPKACLLPDVYHIFKGGSSFEGLSLLSDTAVHVFHVNDYPAEPSREEMKDSHRVFPGDGIAPLSQILSMVGGNGRSVTLSLELFNPDYWQQDALEVARAGLTKMKSAVAAAG
ncbi:MAG: sugar phosphate isomerase/epimerase [Planctomycetaceae bacterium]|nr:sugar phosphate isomerase/epimerase [Planctomycetaceae bacterium]